jgi:hypothetical protein
MVERSQIGYGQGTANAGITAKNIWVGVVEEYTLTPPRIETLIFDKINLLDDAK